MKKKIPAIALFFSGLLMLTIMGLLLSTFKDTDSTVAQIVANVVMIISAGLGICYFVEDCKKGIASKFYVCFMGTLAIGDLILVTFQSVHDALCTALLTVCVACFTLLCFAKDLGQTRSYIFGGVAFAAKICIFVGAAVSAGTVRLPLIAILVLAATALFMICAKYFDKSQRRAK